MHIRSSSAWSGEDIEAFLATANVPLRLACVTPDGAPMMCSLWYLHADSALWCATQQGAVIAKHLQHDSRCAFEIAPETPPYRGVRGQGIASVTSVGAQELLLQLIDRYMGNHESGFAAWLIERSETEVAIKIQPDWITSWDYAARMQPEAPVES